MRSIFGPSFARSFHGECVMNTFAMAAFNKAHLGAQVWLMCDAVHISTKNAQNKKKKKINSEVATLPLMIFFFLHMR